MQLDEVVPICDLLTREVRELCINLLDREGRILTWNAGAVRITRFQAEEALGKTLHFLFPPELNEQRMAERELEAAARDGHYVTEQWRVRKDGGRFWAEEVLAAVHDPDHKLVGFMKIVRDLTERRRMEEELRQSEQRYREVINGVVDYAIFLLDVDRRIVSWNHGATLITGYPELEAVGRSGDMMFIPEDRERGAPMEEADLAAQKGRAEDERWHLRKDGSRFWASGIMTARYDSAGNLVGFSKILRDQTARKHAEEELRTLNETLEQRVNERTSSLLANQKQLRELASELGKTEQRERQRLANELHDHLTQMLAICVMKYSVVRDAIGRGRIPKAADDLRDLLNEALRYTRTLMADLSPIPLHEDDIVEAVEWVAARMKQHGLDVEVVDDKQPKPLSEDFRTLLFQSVRELLYNVVKHADVNRATVTLHREGDRVVIEVSDPGNGFDVAQRAFRPSGAGGFGLFNIRERLQLLGGEIDIDSTPGKGTIAMLRAPLLADAGDKVSKAPAGNRAARPKIRVMLADDHELLRVGLKSVLEAQEDLVVVAEAADGARAITTARQEQPDVILMDVHMPVLNGIEATRRIKSEMPEVQIIALTVYEEPSMEEAMRAAGASAYQQKGASPEVLYQEIRRLAGQRVS